jgi:hypothetical protein
MARKNRSTVYIRETTDDHDTEVSNENDDAAKTDDNDEQLSNNKSTKKKKKKINNKDDEEANNTTISNSKTDTSAKIHIQPEATETTKKNELTQWIPGYTAPLRLEATSTATTKAVGLETKIQMLITKKSKTTSSSSSTSSSLQQQQRHFKTGKLTRAAMQQKKKRDNITAGSSWFDMRPTPMTKQLAHDLQVLKSRAVLDPKRFYKKTETDNQKNQSMVLQVGTVVAGPMEGSTQRLTKAQTKATLADQILAHESKYVMNKYKSMQQEKEIQHQKRKNKRK